MHEVMVIEVHKVVIEVHELVIEVVIEMREVMVIEVHELVIEVNTYMCGGRSSFELVSTKHSASRRRTCLYATQTGTSVTA